MIVPPRALDDEPCLFPVPIDGADNPLAFADWARLCWARFVAASEDGGNWADKTVRRYLADEGLGLRAHF
jgi:hypothetical protein